MIALAAFVAFSVGFLVGAWAVDRVYRLSSSEPNYLNPHCLNDGKPCNPNGDGGCVSCDRVFSGN